MPENHFLTSLQGSGVGYFGRNRFSFPIVRFGSKRGNMQAVRTFP